MKPPLKTCLTIIALLILFATAGNHAIAADQDDAPPATNAVAGADATNATPATTAEAATNEPAAASSTEISERHHRHQDHQALFSDFVLDKGRTNYGDSVVVKGSSTIDGVLHGDSVTVSGDAKVNGVISGDLVVVLGNVELGPDAQIDGQVVVVGGSLKRDPAAKLQEEPIVIDTGKVPGFRGSVDWITKGLLLGRPLPFGVGLAWIVAGICLLVNLLLLLLFPRPLQACVDTVERQPIGSFFTGILVKLLSGLLIALLIVSMVGIIAVPFVLAALVVAFLFGKITIYRYVGQQLGRQIGLGAVQAPALALILGTAIFYLLYAVPFLGFVAWGFSGIFGLGAVAIAAIQKFRSEKPKTVSPTPTPTPPSAPATSSPATTLFTNVPDSPTPAGENHITAAASAPLSTLDAPASTPPPMAAPPLPAASALEVSLLPRAGFWIRLFALALDFFVFLIPMMVVVGHIRNEAAHRVVTLLLLLSWLAYHVGLWTAKGTTIGGIVMGVKVVRLDGRPLDYPVALIRALASVLSAFVLGLGFFWAGFTREKQSWHDKIAGTVIVKAPKGMSLI
jgi:uncharacterized RDD family membrane protein YckC